MVGMVKDGREGGREEGRKEGRKGGREEGKGMGGVWKKIETVREMRGLGFD